MLLFDMWLKLLNLRFIERSSLTLPNYEALSLSFSSFFFRKF